ncbi:hypothetical protein M404DRAFT_736135 [Pisolithus tinctorius Marx 270]|uniref:Uncharacterized protein n=1 Tax=Pisolithus tinctorius Marx 270 TaxID=870435 RepID=A0A0C3NK06_PISTI|nr:hypothetical protein M404DRAFT_736135 [Pisolithus tinctorius Marx 270]
MASASNGNQKSGRMFGHSHFLLLRNVESPLHILRGQLVSMCRESLEGCMEWLLYWLLQSCEDDLGNIWTIGCTLTVKHVSDPWCGGTELRVLLNKESKGF